jgi:hypothetical protein
LQLTHVELLLQIWPVVAPLQSSLLRQLPGTQVPLAQRRLAPNASVQDWSPVQAVQKCVVWLQSLPLHWLFCLQLPGTQLAVAPVPTQM